MASSQRVIVYVDGENFLHRVEDALKADRIIEKKDQITRFGLRGLLSTIVPEATALEIRYYGTRIRINDTEDRVVQERAKIMVESQRRLKRCLDDQDVQFVTAGSLRVREIICGNCRKRSLVFKEKGVDVRCAVDITEEATDGVWQVVVSSDSDLLPALTAARNKQSHLIYVHYAEAPNFAMIKAAHETRVFTKSQIRAAYEETQ